MLNKNIKNIEIRNTFYVAEKIHKKYQKNTAMDSYSGILG